MTDTRSLEICFKPYKERTPQNTGFFRIIGRDPEGRLLNLIRRFYEETKKNGIYLGNGLPEHTKADALNFLKTVGANFELSRNVICRHLSIWLKDISDAQTMKLSESLSEAVRLFGNGEISGSSVKAAYIRFMCWLKEPFAGTLKGLFYENPPKILAEGKLTKASAMFLYALSLSGCDVWYLDFISEENYVEADPEKKLSKLVKGSIFKLPSVHFAGNNTLNEKPPGTPKDKKPVMEPEALCNSWIGDTPVFTAVALDKLRRGPVKNNRPKVVFAGCFGADERVKYRNRLYKIKKDIEMSGRHRLFFDCKPELPSSLEEAPFQALDSNAPRPALAQYMAGWISGTGNTGLLRQAFLQAASYYPEGSGFFEYIVKLICWLRRYSVTLFRDNDASGYPPVVLYYAYADKTEISLFWILAKSGADVLYISPDKNAKEAFSKHFLPRIWLEKDMENSLPFEPYPEKEERLKAGTTAYNAEKELDRLLYDNTGFYRDRQFSSIMAVTLQTTVDEVWQLWNEEAQYRPAFKAENEIVYVPNIFAKITGVDKGDEQLYWSRLRKMVTKNTCLVTNVPFMKKGGLLVTMPQACAFLRGGRLDIDALKSWSGYRYGYLADKAQNLILEKVQLFLDYGMVSGGGPEFPATALSVLLDIDKAILGLIQNFDFTRTIPKVLIVDVTENVFSLRECILLAFLNLVGFDIAVFTPTGYRNLESHMKPDCYETLNAGEYKYGLEIPNLRLPEKPSSWFGKLFKN